MNFDNNSIKSDESSSSVVTRKRTSGGGDDDDDNATSLPSSLSNGKKFKYPLTKTKEEIKIEKDKRKQKRGRIIVRNISYKIKETELKEYFTKFGTIQDFNILKKPDGKLVGCAFVQYEKVNDAAKCILQCSGKELHGRPVFIDWAIDKDRYNKIKKVNATATISNATELAVKSEDIDIKDEIKSESDDSEEDGDDDDDDGDTGNDKDMDDDNDKKDDDIDDMKKPIIKKEPKSNDIVEGCTVFIKNIPYNATNTDFGNCCKRFGAIYYAIINMDSVSGHSKGTGFVKFKSKESADMCLRAGTEFQLFDEVLESCIALSKTDVRNKQNAIKNKPMADSRNLYLLKEGVIMANSPAAEGVSASDMTKRLRMEKIKGQMLKNLNRFISKERLQINNVPPSYDDNKLRKTIQQYTKLKLKECRIMRENKPTMNNPLGQSKGFAFVSLKTHDQALQCLRKLNNNPQIFGQTNRPIVSFSIEDKVAHNIKRKRLERSKEKNPTYKKVLKDTVVTKKMESNAAKKSMPGNRQSLTKKLSGINPKKKSNVPVTPSEFSGVAAEPGVVSNVRSNKKLNEQSDIHMQAVKSKKRAAKKDRAQMEIKREKNSVDRTKKRKRGNEIDSLSFLIGNYHQSLNSTDDQKKIVKKRKKWYVDE